MEARFIPQRNDVILAAAVAVLAAIEIGLNSAVSPTWVALPLELVVAASLAWRRRFPLAVTAAASAGMAVEALAGVPIQEPVVPLAVLTIAVYSLVVHADSSKVVTGLAIVAVGLTITVSSQDKPGNIIFGALWVSGAAFVGRLVRVRMDDARDQKLRAERAEHEREEHVRAASEEERKRIARELHDIIAHSLSVMVVQAGAAEEMLRSDPSRAREPVLAIQQTGREALTEMSRVLGVLREQGLEGELAPQPGLAQLETLVSDVRIAGVSVDFTIEGEPRSLPPGVEVSAYRIVQEALTNTRKHANDGSAKVTLRYLNDALEVDVVDSGGNGQPANGGGLGLVGMRERVAVFGGSLEAGPKVEGGFGVHARLPLGTAQ